MEEPDEDAIDEPTQRSEEAEREAAWMAKGWTRIAAVSILALFLLAFGMLQATGLIDPLGPFVESEAGQWAVYAVLIAVLLGIVLWTWRGT